MNRVKPLTLKELELKEEMKARCLNKGQYIDEKAKDKFYMLCHLEDFEVQYYDLLQENTQLKEKYLNAVADYETAKSENQQLHNKIGKAIRYIKKNKHYIDIEDMKMYLYEDDIEKVLEILKGW